MERFNPEMMVLAREANELSQAELARELGVSQGWLSKIEHGITEPTGDLIIRIAARLDFPISFFYLTDRVYGLPATFHRKRARTPAKALSRIHAEINLIRMHLEKLIRGVELEDSPGIPQIDIDSIGTASAVARAVRSLWRVPPGPIRNLVDVVEAGGGIVIFYDFGTTAVDGVGVRDARIPPIFFINSRIPSDRQRFTLAHEVGHVVMHAIPSAMAEVEANEFAAEFLVPAIEIRGQFQRVSLERLANLKLVWRVSMAALLARARDLGVVSDSGYKYWNIELARAGFKTREPVELDVPTENPAVVRDLLRVYSDDLEYTLLQIGKIVHDSVTRLQRIFPLHEAGPRLVG